MKRLSLLAFILILSACNRSEKNDAEAPVNIPSDGKTSNIPRLKECYQGDEFTCAVEASIVAKTNARRNSSSLTQSFESSFVARHWSDEQLASNTLSHDGFPAERAETLQLTFPDLSFFYSAENVAMAVTNAQTADDLAEEIVEMWWNSSGHRKNMLGPYRYIGVGVAKSGRIVYATQLFH